MVEIEAVSAPLVLSVVGELARALRERFGGSVVDVRLFGSFARAEADEESDVDVAVVLDRVDWKTRCQVIDLATDTGLPHDLRISPTIFERETFERWRAQERPLVMDILRDGVPL